MAILEMSKIYIYGLNEQRKHILEFLHKKEILEIADFNAEENGLLRKETAKSVAQFDSYIASAASAIDILNLCVPEKKGMFSSRIKADVSKYSMTGNETDTVNKKIYEIIRTDKKIKSNEDEIGKINVKQMQIVPYMKLDVPMNYKGTDSTFTVLGTLDGSWDETRIINTFGENGFEDFYFEILNSSKQQTCVWFVFLKDRKNEYLSFLRSMGFLEPPFSLSHRNTSEKYDKLEEEKIKLKNENEELLKSLNSYVQYREEIQLFYDHLVMRKEKYDALSHVGITENTFVISAYIPEKMTEELSKELLQNFDAFVEIEKPEPGEAPVAFSNNPVVAPVEGITSDYSMPSADDIDPNPIMSIFYYFFFGMMFSDAGYGLLMMIACGILGFGKKLEKSKQRPYKMFFYCGVSTTFWGIMYGSFFGDMIDTVCEKFLNSPFRVTPVLMNPTEKPLDLLIMSVAFGLIHILTALVIKFYILWRKGEKANAICDIGFWIFVLLGIGLFAGGMILNVPILDILGKALAVIGVVGLLLTGGRNSANVIGKIFGGVLSLYDITSYVGDALSYSRLMALGLATGVIASVINILGSIAGNSIVGIIVYIIISIFGHALNFAINCLGAYVHTNRLQYVEFYQKFYEGGGKKFKPFAMNTKYFNFSKE